MTTTHRTRLAARFLLGVTALGLSALPLSAGVASADPCDPQSSAPCSGPNVESQGTSMPADPGEAGPVDLVGPELAACAASGATPVALPCAAGAGVYGALEGASNAR
ncbi:hypothetical protein [Actinomycetospora aeridis]|uniref:Uncharacterized protein n=1 Tax=Actinomycetospora aeridis TaxID=3129231 RepID=A0ABU8N483_9PSEU